MRFAILERKTSLDELESGRALEISTRGRLMPASPIRRLAHIADAAKARGTKVFHLKIAQPDIETPACMLDRCSSTTSGGSD